MAPSSGTLDVFESTQVTVSFHPTTVGEHRQDLLLHYHTGERTPPELAGHQVTSTTREHSATARFPVEGVCVLVASPEAADRRP